MKPRWSPDDPQMNPRWPPDEPQMISRWTPACPDDHIDVPETQFFGEFCPTIGNKFRIIKNFKRNEIIKKYKKFLVANGIEIAGIEYIVDENGEIYTYDVNTNTNYNSQAEKASEIKGMKSIATFLKEELLLLNNIRVVAWISGRFHCYNIFFL